MFYVTDTADSLESLELRDEGAKSRVVLAPARGGMVTRFEARGRDVLYLDEATLRDPKANVRGGVPVLFPSPGKLTNDRWHHDGSSGAMKQHGFARDLAFRVAHRSDAGAARATLELVSNDATRAMYPWDFRLSIAYELIGATLNLRISIENTGTRPMPFGLGFHPYFAVPDADKRRTRVPTSATRAFDNVTKEVVPIDTIDLTKPEVDLHLLDHGAPAGDLLAPSNAVHLGPASSAFTRWVVWTLAKKDFVCLEPWTCPADALNTGDGLATLAPASAAELALTIEAR